MAQLVKYLLSKHEDWSSIPSNTIKKGGGKYVIVCAHNPGTAMMETGESLELNVQAA